MRIKINVVIPAYRPDEKLIAIIQMLKKQTLAVDRVVIMNTKVTATDDARDISAEKVIDTVKSESGLEICIYDLSPDEFDHGGTRNIGVSHVSEDCEFVVLMTQDAVPEDEKLIESLYSHFVNENVAAAYARQVAREDSTLAEKFTRSFNYPDEDRIKTEADIEKIGIKAFFCSNVCAMYRRSVYEELGRFVDRAIFNEDMIYAGTLLQAGYSLVYTSEACVIHSHNLSGIEQYRRNKEIARSQSEHPEIFGGLKSESEGIRLVKTSIIKLAKRNKIYLLPVLIWHSGCKYLGFRAGRK